ncbi:MAG: clostripain-related cysteine peptidase [Defluviitaleaceae bacterium]|nr:clostripain-related cysteine peptidase [Defluviitaleaceae bacterium]
MRKFIILFATFFLIAASGVSAKNTVNMPPYTIMIYMNGSDLESEFGAATDDLAEMLDSGLDARNANVIILTGGTKRWQNDAIPEYECIIWHLDNGINELESMGMVNMGNPDTLRDFIIFSMDNFPAEKYGLIMWDHGGGSIAGFGHDEKFGDASLTLMDMKKAFDESGLSETKLEFLGFDACLMATVEMAVLASDYAHVLIAAEDLEPGEGWDYNFLGYLNENPHMSGFELGEIIVDTFIEYFEARGLADEEILTLSVTDLSKVTPVMEAMGKLMAYDEVFPMDFKSMAVRRANTKTFGEGSPRDNYADMVDIGDMALQLADKYPREAKAILHALKDCVTYNRHNSDVKIYGLSTFYIYGGKSQGEYSLETYSALEMDETYTNFLHSFFNGLLNAACGEIIQTELVIWQPIKNNIYRKAAIVQLPITDDISIPTINHEYVSLYPVSRISNSRLYAIPAEVNNRDADIIILFSPKYPQGKIKGMRNYAGGVFQKGYDPIIEGDKISFYQLNFDFDTQTETWSKTKPFTVITPLEINWRTPPDSFKQGYRHTDTCNNVYFDS